MSLVNPVLFSSHFSVSASTLAKAGLLDPILNSDTKLFIDPLLIAKSTNPLIRAKGLAQLESRFRDVIDLVEASASPGDAAWKGAYKALNLDECSETGLGYGGASTSGSSRSGVVRTTILSTAKEIVVLGEKNPNIIPLMGLFESGVGADTISDLTTNYLLSILAEITQDFCEANGVPVTTHSARYGDFRLPANPLHPKGQPVLLVPRDILRDLPLATDWADVSRVILEVEEIRDAVNGLFGNFAKATVTEKKEAVRRAALSSVEVLREILAAVADASDPYDEKVDLSGFYTFRKVLAENPAQFVGLVSKPSTHDGRSLRKVVEEIIEQFRKLVEDNNLWELLWYGSEPRTERAAQLLFFAVANVICRSNDIDISPETNSGGGPVDFKFSTGY